jgi:hypothetical protein
MLLELLAVATVLGVGKSIKAYLEDQTDEEVERCFELQCERALARQEGRQATRLALLSALDEVVEGERAKLKLIAVNLARLRALQRKIELFLASVESTDCIDYMIDTKEAQVQLQDEMARQVSLRERIKVRIKKAKARCACRTGSRRCPSCRGKGERRARIECEECDGDGWNRSIFGDRKCSECVGGIAWSEPSPCGTCHGTGRVQCSKCGGTGRLPPKELLKLGSSYGSSH